MSRWIVVLGILFAGCDSNSPAGPLLEADIVFVGTMNALICFSGFCPGTAEARNAGNGCAEEIAGITRFLDEATGEQLGVADWEYGGRVYPGASFVYHVALVPEWLWARGGWMYQSEANWRNVRC